MAAFCVSGAIFREGANWYLIARSLHCIHILYSIHSEGDRQVLAWKCKNEKPHFLGYLLLDFSEHLKQYSSDI